MKEEITHAKEMLSSGLSFKIIYSILLHDIRSRPTSIQYWEEKLNSDEDETIWNIFFFFQGMPPLTITQDALNTKS